LCVIDPAEQPCKNRVLVVGARNGGGELVGRYAQSSIKETAHRCNLRPIVRRDVDARRATRQRRTHLIDRSGGKNNPAQCFPAWTRRLFREIERFHHACFYICAEEH